MIWLKALGIGLIAGTIIIIVNGIIENDRQRKAREFADAVRKSDSATERLREIPEEYQKIVDEYLEADSNYTDKFQSLT